MIGNKKISGGQIKSNQSVGVSDDLPNGWELIKEENYNTVFNSDDFNVSYNNTQNAIFIELKENNLTGWGDYVDTQYTSGSPFSILADTDYILPNNSATVVNTQKPTDITSFVEVVTDATSGLGYDHSKITGRNGDGISITVDFEATPTEVGTTYIEFWFDITGGTGTPSNLANLYRRIITFPKGNGVSRPINFTVTGYTLVTWQTNGAEVKIRANGTADISGVRYVVTRTHKAKPIILE